MTGATNNALAPGARVEGRFEIIGELGMGSFGRVFKAKQISTGQLVALKFVRPAAEGDPVDLGNRIQRFRRETRVCAELWHPNIVRLIDSGESSDGTLYAAFEYVPGATLKGVLTTEGKLGVAESIHLMTQVLDALSCAHARGIVHRDLKPENVMITKTGARRNASVLDFGLGGFATETAAASAPRITATRELLGTPCYAAPEQLRGEPVTARADLYSWGLMFLECLTGELAVRGASPQEVIQKQLGPDPVSIPEWLRNHPLGRILELATAKSAERREVSVETLLDALSSYGVPAEASTRTVDPALVDRERRQLTVACCRVTIATTDGSDADIEDVDQQLQTERAALEGLANRAGAVVGTATGDRIFLVFGYPQAHEDDARRAARLASEIVSGGPVVRGRLRVGFRVGINTGLVIVRDRRYQTGARLEELTGLTPEIAGCLADRAQSGEVLTSIETHRLLRGEFETEPAGECPIAELSRPIPVLRLRRARRTDTAIESRSLAGMLLTPLVGRGTQLQQLVDGWTRAKEGQGGAVLVTGEAGIGKTRLLQEMRSLTDADATWLRFFCAPESQRTPLRPVVEMLAAMDTPIEALLSRLGLDVGENVPIFASLMSLPPDDRRPALHLSPERQKELTLQAIVALVFRIAEEKPALLAIENLHWADPTTVELAGLLLQELATARSVESAASPKLFIVFTTRPELVPLWSGEAVAVMPLARLLPAEVESMIHSGVGGATELPRALIRQVIDRSEGVPLFVEELTRVVVESARSAEGSIGSNVRIPMSLRDLLTARLDRLSMAARETAQLASVLGREFRYDVLEASSAKDPAFLREDVLELGRAGLVLRRRGPRGDVCAFRHALLRDAAYEAMTRGAAQHLHRRVAGTLGARFPEIAAERPELLAHHFELGGEIESAVEQYHRAGDRAMKRGAYVEAGQQLEKGLGLLRTRPESSGRDRLEVELLTTLGTVQFSTKGYGSEDVEQTFSRAREIGEALREETSPKVLTGVMGVHFTRSDRESTRALLPIFRELATRSDAVSAITGHATLGLAAFFEGNLLAARASLAEARRYTADEEFRKLAREWGYDGGMLVYAWQMMTLWQLGFPDQAEAVRAEMLAIAEETKEPYSILLALSFGTTLTDYRGETEKTLELVARLMALSTEQRLYAWLASAMVAQGSLQLQNGEAEGAIAQIDQGLTLFRAAGVMLSYSWFLPDLAAAYAAAGKLDQATATVDEGLARCETELVRFHEPDLWRVKGEIEFLRGDADAAAASFAHSLGLARERSAKSLELRAAIANARMLRSQGKTADARALLAGVYGWFTEGFETKDLRAARALLADAETPVK